MRPFAAGLAVLGVATASALATLGVSTVPLRIVPDTSAWERFVVGSSRDGRVRGGAAALFPGLDRGARSRLVLRAEALDGESVALGVRLDRGPFEWSRLSRTAGAVFNVPPAGSPGLRVELRLAEPSASVRIRSLELHRTDAFPWARVLGSLALVSLLTGALLTRLPSRLALSLGLLFGGALALAATPLLLLFTLEDPAVWPRLVPPLLLLLASLAAAAQDRELRRFGFGVTLIAAAVFGGWVRLYFLPSAGAWDMEYWKACALRGNSHGVTRVYGDPQSIPPGHFLSQLRGEEPQWRLEALGQSFVIDQPPGIQALWTVSWWGVSRLHGRMDRGEALNVAAKLPATLGDVLAVLLLLAVFRERLRLGALLAALFWALPISWLSSAVLGFFDGAPAAVAVLALVMAGRGRAGWTGALLALAALLKATALLVAPAAAVALWAVRAPLLRAVVAGAVVLVIALVPFAVDGTLGPAIVHVYRILFQERLSGGFANPWWLAGAFVAARDGSWAWSEKVPFVRIEALAFPARTLGAAAMGLLVGWVAWLGRRRAGPHAAALVGFTLVFGYAMLAIGVHENHPHLLVLCLLATGLWSWRLRLIAGMVLTTYTLNMLALSGLGRFYGSRHMALAPLVTRVEGLRLGLGFDITLLLALVNALALVLLVLALPSELAASASAPPAAPAQTRQPAPPVPQRGVRAIDSAGGGRLLD
jgi:hypothetical protein